MILKVITTICTKKKPSLELRPADSILTGGKLNSVPSQPSAAHRQNISAGFHVCFGSTKTNSGAKLEFGLGPERKPASCCWRWDKRTIAERPGTVDLLWMLSEGGLQSAWQPSAEAAWCWTWANTAAASESQTVKPAWPALIRVSLPPSVSDGFAANGPPWLRCCWRDTGPIGICRVLSAAQQKHGTESLVGTLKQLASIYFMSSSYHASWFPLSLMTTRIIMSKRPISSTLQCLRPGRSTFLWSQETTNGYQAEFKWDSEQLERTTHKKAGEILKHYWGGSKSGQK